MRAAVVPRIFTHTVPVRNRTQFYWVRGINLGPMCPAFCKVGLVNSSVLGMFIILIPITHNFFGFADNLACLVDNFLEVQSARSVSRSAMFVSPLGQCRNGRQSQRRVLRHERVQCAVRAGFAVASHDE